MSADNKPDPLIEWNRLHRHNSEQEFVRVLLDALNRTSPILNSFSQWLLVGTAATVALLISELSSLLPVLSQTGFKLTIALLMLSIIFGLTAKVFSIQCEASLSIEENMRPSFDKALDEYTNTSETIQEHARERGINLETAIDLKATLVSALSGLPKYVQRSAAKGFDNGSKDWNFLGKRILRKLGYQSLFTTLQVVVLFVFVANVVYWTQAVELASAVDASTESASPEVPE